MYYPIAIEPGDETHAFGVVVPDLPGCFSGGDTLEEAIENAKEAVALWIETALDNDREIPKPSPIASVQANEEYTGWVMALVDVDPALVDDKAERVNITIPRRILARIDRYAASRGETRSGLLVRAALEKIASNL
ncbi:MAG: type II toxin-antitoxin system HicB family antitoxin [Deltaproteobacteria bacterium]|nr:type II toxin-antitoxin system HicB family antitoxin [Deltaproteobacteria bacterium]